MFLHSHPLADSQPLNITLVLHSASALSWTLSMVHLLTSVQSTAPSSLLILLTNRRSQLALEQLHLPGWRISVERRTLPSTTESAAVAEWVESKVFGGLPLTLSVNFPALHTGEGGGARMPLELVNALDLTLLPSSTPPLPAADDRQRRRIMHDKTDLSNWLTGFIDISLDEGFTSCHTPGIWRQFSTTPDTTKRVMLLQTLEFGPDFAIPGSKGKLSVQLRVQTDAPRLSKPRVRVLALYARSDRLNFLVDLRGLSDDLIIHVSCVFCCVVLWTANRRRAADLTVFPFPKRCGKKRERQEVGNTRRGEEEGIVELVAHRCLGLFPLKIALHSLRRSLPI